MPRCVCVRCVANREREKKRKRQLDARRGRNPSPTARIIRTYGVYTQIYMYIYIYERGERFVEQLSKIDIARALMAGQNKRGERTSENERPAERLAERERDSRENQYGEILSLAECFPGMCLVVVVHVLPDLYRSLPRLFRPRPPRFSRARFGLFSLSPFAVAYKPVKGNRLLHSGEIIVHFPITFSALLSKE